MSDLTDLLDEIQDRVDRATKGSWDAYSVPASRGEAGYSAVEVSDTEVQVTRDVGGWFDADFIARARDDVPRLVAALRAVLRQADALDELAASPIGSVHAGALSLGARSVRRAITEALGVES